MLFQFGDMYSVIILIILSIAVFGTLFLILYKRILILIYRIKKKKSKAWYYGIIPEELLKSINPDENIIFKSERIKYRKKVRKVQIEALLGVLGFVFMIDLLITSISDMSYFMIFSGFLIAPFAMRSFSREHKKDCYFLLTNKKLHCYFYYYKAKHYEISILEYSTLIGVSLTKKFHDKKGDYGTVFFISFDEIPRKFMIGNIPNFTYFQTIIESILYEFGNVKQLKINFPTSRKVKVSEFKYQKNMKSIRGFIISITITIIISILIYYFLDLYFFVEIWYNWIVIGAIVFFNGFMGIYLLREIILTKLRTTPRNSLLIIENDYIKYHSDIVKIRIDLSRYITFGFAKSKNPTTNPMKLEQNYDYIEIYDINHPKIKIKIGPVDNITEELRFLSGFLLDWKAKQELLYSKENLLNLDRQLRPDIIKEVELEKVNKQFSEQMLIESLKSSVPKEKIDFYQYVLELLSPNEKVIKLANPQVSIIKPLLRLIVGSCYTVLTIIFISFYITSPPYLLSIILNPILIFLIPIISVFGVFIFCCLGSGFYSLYRTLNNTTYLLTNDQLMIITPKGINNLKLENINSATKSETIEKTYNIDIVLKKPDPRLEGIFKFAVSLSHISQENYFYEQLQFLMKHKIINEIDTKDIKLVDRVEENVDPRIYTTEATKALSPMVLFSLISVASFIFTTYPNLWVLGLIIICLGIVLYVFLKRSLKKNNPESSKKKS